MHQPVDDAELLTATLEPPDETDDDVPGALDVDEALDTGGAKHMQPASMRHRELQQSPLARLPSSQYSAPSTQPLPQKGVELELLVEEPDVLLPDVEDPEVLLPEVEEPDVLLPDVDDPDVDVAELELQYCCWQLWQALRDDEVDEAGATPPAGRYTQGFPTGAPPARPVWRKMPMVMSAVPDGVKFNEIFAVPPVGTDCGSANSCPFTDTQ